MLYSQCILVCRCKCDHAEHVSQIFFGGTLGLCYTTAWFANYIVNTTYNCFPPQMTRGRRSIISSRATFVTLSRALCSKGVLALFGLSKLPIESSSSSTFPDDHEREEMIDRFKIPRDACKFLEKTVML